ncbi:MAG: hypothetical protein OXE79_03960 [Acidimicrobiaceae bacterium]|nr:hypothetical protein [Acidimicrobiaceae bacterium]MCY4279773.1 hypothetical protein [Acidimicrobiaceae bacterium]MCY4294511.1 hypothetical protein [Acidimicrobiaceae bacterium]
MRVRRVASGPSPLESATAISDESDTAGGVTGARLDAPALKACGARPASGASTRPQR